MSWFLMSFSTVSFGKTSQNFFRRPQSAESGMPKCHLLKFSYNGILLNVILLIDIVSNVILPNYILMCVNLVRVIILLNILLSIFLLSINLISIP